MRCQTPYWKQLSRLPSAKGRQPSAKATTAGRLSARLLSLGPQVRLSSPAKCWQGVTLVRASSTPSLNYLREREPRSEQSVSGTRPPTGSPPTPTRSRPRPTRRAALDEASWVLACAARSTAIKPARKTGSGFTFHSVPCPYLALTGRGLPAKLHDRDAKEPSGGLIE